MPDLSDVDKTEKEIVTDGLPKLLRTVTSDLRVLFGSQLEEVLRPALGDSDEQERTDQGTEARTAKNVEDDCATVMNTLGLRLRRVVLKGGGMSTTGGARIEPENVVIDCVMPQKLIGFLRGLNPVDVLNGDLRDSLQGLGQEFYDQICFRYDLDSPGDMEIGLLGNLPLLAEEFRRLELPSITKKLADCSAAIQGKYIREYALVASEGIFENDISMRYVDKNEHGWYEIDWNKTIKTLLTAYKNPSARQFVLATRDDLLGKAQQAQQIFSQWQPRTDGYYFAHMAQKTLTRVIPILETIDQEDSCRPSL